MIESDSPFPVLKTKRLLLRAMNNDDAAAIAALRSIPSVNEFIDRAKSMNEAEALAFIGKMNNGVAEGRWLYWALQLHESTTLIGTACLWNFNQEKTRAEIGYEVHPDFQGLGMMSRTVNEVLRYAFKTLQLETVEANVQPQNQRSIALLLRCGFVFEKMIDEKKETTGEPIQRAIYVRSR